MRNINLVIQKGKSIGIYGRSIAGKSTLLNLITGLIDPSEGEILVDGKKIINNYAYLTKILVMFLKMFLCFGNITDNIRFGTDIESTEIKNLIKLVGLENLLDSMKNKEQTVIGEAGQRVSGGENQRSFNCKGSCKK